MKENVLIIAIALVVLGFGGFLIRNDMINHEMEQLARESLAKQGSFQSTVMGKDVIVIFEQGEYANKATVTRGDKEIVKQDINKTKILGQYVGEKSKEFMSGFFKGRKKTSKHGTE